MRILLAFSLLLIFCCSKKAKPTGKQETPVDTVNTTISEVIQKEDESSTDMTLISQGRKQNNPPEWISSRSMAAVVKINHIYITHTVKNLPRNYEIEYTDDGKLDIGDAELLETKIETIGAGSGVIIAPYGLILTNAHVTKYEPKITKLSSNTNKIFLTSSIDDVSLFSIKAANEIEINDNNNTKLEKEYIALLVAEDDDISDQTRDRSVLIIAMECSDITNFDTWENLDFPNQDFPYAELANPFEISVINNKITAVGFPGVADNERISKTTGDFLGYKNTEQSIILHTAWISFGNSGGALFYKDKLIGINTWFNSKDVSHPVSLAQPITYWNDLLLPYFFEEVNGFSLNPDLYNWIDSDPSSDSYKNLCLITLDNSEFTVEPYTSFEYYIYKTDNTLEDTMYFKYQERFKRYCNAIQMINNENKKIKSLKRSYNYYDDYGFYDDYSYNNYNQEPDLASISSKSNLDIDTVKYLYTNNIEDINDIRTHLSSSALPYFDIWQNDSFYISKVNYEMLIKPFLIPFKVQKNGNYTISLVNNEGEIIHSKSFSIGTEYFKEIKFNRSSDHE